MQEAFNMGSVGPRSESKPGGGEGVEDRGAIAEAAGDSSTSAAKRPSDVSATSSQVGSLLSPAAVSPIELHPLEKTGTMCHGLTVWVD